jgi:hypothetical protein
VCGQESPRGSSNPRDCQPTTGQGPSTTRRRRLARQLESLEGPGLRANKSMRVASKCADSAHLTLDAALKSLAPPAMGVHYSSETPEWGTPQDLFEALDAEFKFTLDVCATTRPGPSTTKRRRFARPRISGYHPLIGSARCHSRTHPPARVTSSAHHASRHRRVIGPSSLALRTRRAARQPGGCPVGLVSRCALAPSRL